MGGIIEGTSQQSDYFMHIFVLGTNLWQPSGSLEQSVLVLIPFAAAITLVMSGRIVMKYKKKKAR